MRRVYALNVLVKCFGWEHPPHGTYCAKKKGKNYYYTRVIIIHTAALEHTTFLEKPTAICVLAKLLQS